MTLAALAGITRIEYAPAIGWPRIGYGCARAAQANLGSQMSDCVLLVQDVSVFTPDFMVGLRELCRRVGCLEGVERVLSLDQVPVFTGLLPGSLLPEDVRDETALARARDMALTHPLVPGYLLSSDGRSNLVLVQLSDTLDGGASLASVVAELKRTAREVADVSSLRIAVTGTRVVRADLLQFMQEENLRLFTVPLLLGLIIGLLVFRRLSPLIVTGIPPLIGVFLDPGDLGLAENQVNHDWPCYSHHSVWLASLM